MWLKRAVGLSMITTFVILNGMVVLGLFVPDRQPPAEAQTVGTEPVVGELPSISLTMTAATIPVGSSAGLSWTTTGNPTTCTATGAWSGSKTPFGSESTGRMKQQGTYSYAIECTNAAGSSQASAKLTVGPANSTPTAVKPVTVTSTTSGKTFCGGRLPCYGPADLAKHTSAGSCWGYNLDRVINISGFDTAYHQVKSGISSIKLSSVCGQNLAASLGGQVTAEGQTRNHNTSTKQNSDKNLIPYFVGYYDASKS
jgi:hypothetical protein